MRYLIVLLMLSGCATSTQRFSDKSYEDGKLVREVKANSLTISPPFMNARSEDLHKLDMSEDGEGWSVEMGSDTDMKGGDSAEVVGSVISGAVGLR